MTHITKEGLLQAIEEQRGLALLDGYKPTQLDNILARAAELSAQDASPKYHSINCLSLQSEDNPPLPCDCGAGPTGLTPQEMETASPKDGWKLVPVEMTAWMRKFSGINEWRWKAALDAAPKPEPPSNATP